MIHENLKKIKNPPLKSLSCEIRFPTLLKIVDTIPDFQNIIRETLPNYYTQSIPVASKHGIVDEFSWNFRSDLNGIGLRVKNNLIVLQSDKHVKFSVLLEYIKDFFGEFFRVNEINNFSRIGLRYINREDFNEEEPNLDNVLRYFNLIYTNLEENVRINNFNVQFNRKEDNYYINIINKYSKRQDDRYSFLFDYDCYYMDDLDIDNYLDILENLHDKILKSFEENITNEYLQILMSRE